MVCDRVEAWVEKNASALDIAQLRCEGCGTHADAACGCGVGYPPVKASVAAAKAIAADPVASNRAIATKVGVDEGTVRKARGQVRNNSAPEKRLGRDGKSYPAAPTYSADDVDEDVPEPMHLCGCWAYADAPETPGGLSYWFVFLPKLRTQCIRQRNFNSNVRRANSHNGAPYPQTSDRRRRHGGGSPPSK